MFKLFSWSLCAIYLITQIKNLNVKGKGTYEAPCYTSDNCSDIRMVCSINKTCVCSKFHDWYENGSKCVANISKIFRWFRNTMSTVPEYVSQQVDFKMVQVEPFTVFVPKWSEYEVVEEQGTQHVLRVIWPILFGVVIVMVVYGAILLGII